MSKVEQRFTDGTPAWVRETCPTWCANLHTDKPYGDDVEIHSKFFGWNYCDDLVVNVLIGRDGSWESWDSHVETQELLESRDLDAMARTAHRAAQWIRSTVMPRIELVRV